MQQLRLLLLPFSVLYGFVIWLRNRLYDWAWFKQNQTDQALTVVVGNLEVGGTGKSPMIEFLIRKCQQEGLQIATLSRGYGRKTKGFQWVTQNSTAAEVGDEPLQFRTKFPEIGVAVCEDRWLGVQKLAEKFDLILLDDAFQHRALRPHFSILLFDYQSLERRTFLLPAGNFRDSWNERGRADAWVVTKCPGSGAPSDALEKIQSKLSFPSKEIPTYFSGIQYLGLVCGNSQQVVEKGKNIPEGVLLVTGIAKPKALVEYVHQNFSNVAHINFPDHYDFTKEDYARMVNRYHSMSGENNIILTTEKDAQRIRSTASAEFLALPWYYIPIQVDFIGHPNGEDLFSQIRTLLYSTLPKYKLQSSRSQPDQPSF